MFKFLDFKPETAIAMRDTLDGPQLVAQRDGQNHANKPNSNTQIF